MGTLSVNEVPIAPQSEAAWVRYDLSGSDSDLNGRLYVPKDGGIVDDPLELFRSYASDPDGFELLGTPGSEGVVRSVGGYALKNFNSRSSLSPITPGEIHDIRASVGLTEGLAKIKQPDNRAYDIRGINLYAAFIPETPLQDTAGRELQGMWLMEQVASRGNISTAFGAPRPKEIRALYENALKLVGMSANDVELDDSPDNTLLEKALTLTSRGSLVRIDVGASSPRLYY